MTSDSGFRVYIRCNTWPIFRPIASMNPKLLDSWNHWPRFLRVSVFRCLNPNPKTPRTYVDLYSLETAERVREAALPQGREGFQNDLLVASGQYMEPGRCCIILGKVWARAPASGRPHEEP